MDKMAIYNHLPVFAQNLACTYEGWKIKRARYSKEFWRYLAEYESRAKWSYEQLCDYRDARLRKMIHHCYDTVPYYTKLFNEGGINPDSIKTLDDLKVLPILTKETINANPEEFISSAVLRDKMVTSHTSGTTGSGFIFKTTQEALCEQWAVWWRYRRALGIKYGTMCAQLGGRSVVPITCEHPPFYRWNRPCSMMYFSTYHMNRQNMYAYVDAMRSQNITWLHGYPSSICVLAEYLNENREQMKLNFVTIGAENLLESQKTKIISAFCTEPYQHYGMSEGVANTSEDIHHQMTVDEDYAAVEFVPINGMGSCDIIGTNLTNFAMPFIRYKTNDIGTVLETAHGRVVTALDGRAEDYVVLPNGAKIGRLDHVFKDLIHIREAQIVQTSLDRVQVNVVRGALYGPDDEDKLRSELAMRLGCIGIDVNHVDMIERTATGKLRFVVSQFERGVKND